MCITHVLLVTIFEPMVVQNHPKLCLNSCYLPICHAVQRDDAQSNAFSSGSVFKSLVSTNSTTPAMSSVKSYLMGIKPVLKLGAIEKPTRRDTHPGVSAFQFQWGREDSPVGGSETTE